MNLDFDPNDLTIPMIRVQVSLGSMIDSIENITDQGLTIHYAIGDRCRRSSDHEYYSSSINFICDMASVDNPNTYDQDLYERPLLSKVRDGCHYEFTWRTKNACRFCTHDDVDKELSECLPDKTQKNNGFNGYRHLFYKVKEGKNCVIREYASMISDPKERDKMIVPGKTEIVKCNFL